MGDLARPVGPIRRVGMIGGVADEAEIAAVGILAAKAVTAAGARQFCRRCRLRSSRRDGAMQRVDVLPVGEIEHDAHDCGLRSPVQTDEMMVGGAAAEETRVVARLDRREIPYGFVKARCFVEIGDGEVDATHAANETRRLDCWHDG